MSDYTLTDLDTGEMIELTERQFNYFIRSAKRETQKLNLALDSNALLLSENSQLLLERDSAREGHEAFKDLCREHTKTIAKLREVQTVVCCACGQLNQHQPALEEDK
jgi:hypothetical protein